MQGYRKNRTTSTPAQAPQKSLFLFPHGNKTEISLIWATKKAKTKYRNISSKKQQKDCTGFLSKEHIPENFVPKNKVLLKCF